MEGAKRGRSQLAIQWGMEIVFPERRARSPIEPSQQCLRNMGVMRITCIPISPNCPSEPGEPEQREMEPCIIEASRARRAARCGDARSVGAQEPCELRRVLIGDPVISIFYRAKCEGSSARSPRPSASSSRLPTSLRCAREILF